MVMCMPITFTINVPSFFTMLTVTPLPSGIQKYCLKWYSRMIGGFSFPLPGVDHLQNFCTFDSHGLKNGNSECIVPVQHGSHDDLSLHAFPFWNSNHFLNIIA